MIRGIMLLIGIVLVLGITVLFNSPFSGLLLWIWFALNQPHEETYSFMKTLPLNVVIAAVTMLAWLFSRERKVPPNQFIIWALLVFLAWMTLNSFHAYDPAWSWPFWNRTWKTVLLAIMVAVLATNRVRIDAIIWICVLSLFYYSIKGGLFTLLTGGVNHVRGPPRSEIGDNNQLALALLMTMPLAIYLRRHIVSPWISRGLAAGLALTVVSIIGTYSRGALIGLVAFAVIWLLRSRRKLLYLAMASVAAFAVVAFMPAHFLQRASTIKAIGEGASDPSVHGRVVAWQVAYDYARDHFPYGAGFYGPQLKGIFNYYFPSENFHAAHSIYFQVLGEHGFVGLFLYLVVISGGFWTCWRVIRRTRSMPEFKWAEDLARMLMLSLFLYCLGGAALSVAYYDLFLIILTLIVVLNEMTALPRGARTVARPRLVVQPQQSAAT